MWPITWWHVRRIALVASGLLVIVAIMMFLNVQISETQGGTVELINGRADAGALLLPLALFIAGMVGLMAALGWRPER